MRKHYSQPYIRNSVPRSNNRWSLRETHATPGGHVVKQTG
ncbi:TPA: DUF4761 family protein, partial [Escherichia coli]|nr:DUF4761 family protein [Escherichia coli]